MSAKPRVIVFHPQTQHSHFLAVGVQRAGLLEAHITQLYYSPEHWPFNWMKFLPAHYRQKIDKKLYNRHRAELDASRVITINTASELFFVLLNRIRPLRRLAYRWVLPRVAHRFSRRVGQIASERADIVIGIDSSSRDAFRILHKKGVICVLDQSCAHYSTQKRIYEEEKQLQPLFAETMQDMNPPDDIVEYARQEVQLADFFVVASSFPKQSLIDLGVEPDRIFKVPYGVDLELFKYTERPIRSDNEMRVLYVGHGDQRKGLGYLLEAIHQLRPDYHITLTLCGRLHPIFAQYERYQGDYISLGYVDQLRMPDIYAQSDVFVLPTLADGFSRAIIEAMASGMPTIGTFHCGLPDTITDGVEGYVIPIRDVDAIKRHLVELYDNPAKRREMGRAAHEKVKSHYSWNNYYDGIARALAEMWEKRQR